MKPKTTVTSVLETFPSLHKLIVCCKFDDMAWLLCRTYWNNLKYGKKIVNAAGNEGSSSFCDSFFLSKIRKGLDPSGSSRH